MKLPKPPGRGFTLIELMVTVAIVALALTLAAPNFTAFQRNAELTSFTNTLLAAMNTARSEALKRGAYAAVIPADGVNWSSGLIVYTTKTPATAYSAATDVTVFTREASPSYLTISGTGVANGSSPYIMFDASGFSKDKSAAVSDLTLSVVRNDVASAEADEQTRRIKVSRTGRARVCKPSNDTSCTTSDNE